MMHAGIAAPAGGRSIRTKAGAGMFPNRITLPAAWRNRRKTMGNPVFRLERPC